MADLSTSLSLPALSLELLTRMENPVLIVGATGADPVDAASQQTSASLQVTFANPAAQKLLGSSEPLAGRPLSSVPAGADLEPLLRSAKPGSISELTPPASLPAVRCTAIPLSGGRIALLADASSPVPSASSETASPVDTHRAKSVGVARIHFLSELIGAFAHEINNPLAVIHGRAGVLRTQLKSDTPPPPDKILTVVERIEQTTHRMSELIRGIRDFARDASGEPPQPVAVSTVVNEALALCATRFRNHGIDVKTPEKIDPLLLVNSRGSDLQQLLLHLMLNARDAVTPLPEKWITVEVGSTGKSVEISVTDSGKGVPAEIRDRLHQPFFTTKAGVRNAGLGLFLSNDIAASLGGNLRLDPDSPNTRFVLSLPLAG